MAGSVHPGVFFQRCEIRATSVLIDYKPRRVDVGALRTGNLMEVINLTGWADVAIALPGVTLKGVHGCAVSHENPPQLTAAFRALPARTDAT